MEIIDREKVIKGLECCMSEQICKGCPYKEKDECEDGGYYYSKAIEDAIGLLKEQEAKKVIIDMYGNYCPWCSTKTTREMGVQKLHLGTRFCPYCGKAVDWT